MPQLVLLVIVVVALHLLLGWPVIAGFVIAAAPPHGARIHQTFSQANGQNRPAVFGISSRAIGRTIIAAVLAYVPMVLVYFFTGHATW
ncbi:MAG TPA: hypothetical protein VN939_16595 [Chthoniobacterales bacterium]|jgi:hypothetical protein|nr:hypothetical protein [Chthoniobacterales bacterium]